MLQNALHNGIYHYPQPTFVGDVRHIHPMTELPQLAVLSFTHWLTLAPCIVILEHFQHLVFK